MNLHRVIKQVEKFATDNSPLILTTVGAVGVVTTAYLTGKASFKAAAILTEYEDRPKGYIKDPSPTELKTKINLVWKEYIPAIGTGVLTVAAIIGANQIGMRRAAAMTTALALSEKAFDEYKHKVVEKIGEKKAMQVRDEIVQDKIDANPVGSAEIILTGGGEVVCYEAYTGRYFKSDIETLKKAQNDINYRVNSDGYASLSDFYDKVGLGHTEVSDDIGWAADKKLLELEFVGHIDETGKPVIGVIYQTEPLRDYWKFRG